MLKLHFESLSPPDDEDEEDEDEEKDEEEDEEDDGFKVDTTVLCALTPGKVCFETYGCPSCLISFERSSKPPSTSFLIATLHSSSRTSAKSMLCLKLLPLE